MKTEQATGTERTPDSLSAFKVKGVRLKVCPFCCQAPIVMDVGDDNKALMIECVTEGCVNPCISYYDREFAVKLWNWRKPFARKPRKTPEEHMAAVKEMSRAAAQRAVDHPETASHDTFYEQHPEKCS